MWNAGRKLSQNVSSDARLASGAYEADWSGWRALTGQGRGSLRAAGAPRLWPRPVNSYSCS